MRWLPYLLLLSVSTPIAANQSESQFAAARARMTRLHVVEAGIAHQGVVRSIRETPRHLFVPADQRKYAYFDMALPIGSGQTISPPFVVASMTQQLDPQRTDKVLEIGTGSGYQAAVLSPLVAEVYSIEIVDALARKAAHTLRRLDYDNVFTKQGDGYQGWPEHAPFDKIIVTCSPERIPRPLVEQLREGGRIVIPLGERYQQTLYLARKVDGKIIREDLEPTFFVPMTGQAEELRRKMANDGLPRLVNGSFEETDDDGALRGWYYVRQATTVSDEAAPDGQSWLQFANETPGRGSQALQAIGVDGRTVDTLQVRMMIALDDVRPGLSARQLPRMELNFFDRRRALVGTHVLGPWYGSVNWTEKQATIEVPPTARLSVLTVGLCGATGTFSVDQVRVTSSQTSRRR